MSSNELANQGDGMLFCAHCGTKNAADAYSCDRCGERIYFPDPTQPPPLGLAECPKCVTANEARASYCVKCGSSMANAARINVLGSADRSRQAPHADPAGIRISPRSRDVPRPVRRPPASSRPQQQRPPAEHRSPEDAARAREAQEQRRAREREQSPRWAGRPESRQRSQPQDEGPVINDSGTRSARLPTAARGWNTAAMLFAPIWGPANGVWIGVLSLIFLALPLEFLDWSWKLTLYFAFGIFMGFRGNEMAWRSRRWESVEHFKRVQQLWTIAALGGGLAAVVLLAALIQS